MTLRDRAPAREDAGRRADGRVPPARGDPAGAARLPATLLFLAAFLIYNDGVQTVIALASVYGSEELGLARHGARAAILMVQFLAFAGALLLGRRRPQVGARTTVLASLAVWTALLVAA